MRFALNLNLNLGLELELDLQTKVQKLEETNPDRLGFTRTLAGVGVQLVGSFGLEGCTLFNLTFNLPLWSIMLFWSLCDNKHGGVESKSR